MAKKNNIIRKFVSKALIQVGRKSAEVSCNQSCIYIAYEPKQPNALKKR